MIRALKYLANRYFSRVAVPYWIVLVIDSLTVLMSGYMAAYLEYGGLYVVGLFWQIMLGMVIVDLFFAVFFKLFHTYAGILRYSSFADLINVASASFCACAVSLCVALPLNRSGVTGVCMPDPVGMAIVFLLSTMGMWMMRVLVKVVFDIMNVDQHTVKAFIYGTAQGAVSIAKSVNSERPARYSIKGFVSPVDSAAVRYLMGKRVYSDGPGLIAHLREAGATAILVSPLQTESFRGREDLIDGLIQEGIRIFMVPDPEEWDGRSDTLKSGLKEVDIEDLLPREKIDIDMSGVADLLHGKKILVTGAAGSIGSEIVRQIASFGPSDMILIDQAETPMHDVRLMMEREYGACTAGSLKVETIVASITDQLLMEQIISKHRPEYIFHAAAYKHVPMMEDNPVVAVRNNIHGTRILADLAVRYGVRKFVMISTDKAVNPTNVMGCSKRICEIYCQSLNKAIADGGVKGVTQFVTTRFGNVLGSSGSVIPLFREQIASGGPVTVTDPDIIRYFMLIPEACKLVLEAGAMGHGGEIFAFDMGKPVKIVDLARRMIALSGARDVQIKFTGLRDGEKLYEEVLSDRENTRPTANPKILVASVREYDYALACGNEDRLMEATYSSTPAEIVHLMEEIVPEYRSNNKHYR